MLDLGVDEGWSIEKLVAEITDNRVLVDFTKKLVNANARIDEVRRLVYSMRFDLDMHGGDVLESIKYVAETEILDRKTLDFILETKWGVDDWSSVIINQISHLDSSLIESYSLSLLELIERAGPPDHDICQRYRDEIYSKIDTDKKSTIIFSLFNLTDDYINLQRVFLDEAFKLIKQDLLAEKSFTLIQSVLDSGYKKSEILSLISETLRDENIDYRDHSLKLLDILISEKKDSVSLGWKAFEYAVNRKLKDKQYRYWSLSLQGIDTKEKLSSFIKRCNNLTEKNGHVNVVYSWIDRFLAENPDDTAEEILDELRLIYGIYLFDTEKMQQRSFNILSQHFEKNINDNRVWIPLYFLGHRLGEKAFLINLLNTITPRLKVDATPLNNYPLTVESLDSNLENLEQELKKEGKFISENKKLNESLKEVSYSNYLNWRFVTKRKYVREGLLADILDAHSFTELERYVVCVRF